MRLSSHRRAILLLLPLFLAVARAREPCAGVPSLSFAVDDSATASLRLDVEKYTDAHDLWTLDFESHRDDTLAIVNRDLFPDTFGTCATIRKTLDTPTAFAPNFDPIASGGGTLVDAYARGKEPPPQPRVDSYSFDGPLVRLLDCKSSRDAFVFTATTIDEETAIVATVYATCFGSDDPANVSAPIRRVEYAFPVRIEASRSVVARVIGGASIGDIEVVSVRPSLVDSSPIIVDRVGLTFFLVEMMFNVTSSSGNAYTLYNPDVTPKFVDTGRATVWRNFPPGVRNGVGENPGTCVTLPSGACSQELFYRVSMRADDPLSDVQATLEGQFSFDFDPIRCTGPDPGTSTCNGTGASSSTFVLNVVVRMRIVGGLASEEFGIGVAFSGLFDVVNGNDVTTRNVYSGERFGLRVQVTPAAQRSDFGVQLKELLLCILADSVSSCSPGPNTRLLSTPGSVATRYLPDLEAYQVDFTMVGLSAAPNTYYLTADFVLNRTSHGFTKPASVTKDITYQGCLNSSSIFNPSDGSCARCRDGYKLEDFRCVSTTTAPPRKPNDPTTPNPVESTVTPSRAVWIGYHVLATVGCLLAAVFA